MRVLFCCSLLLLLSGSFAGAAEPIDSTAALNVAKAFRPYVSEGKPGPLWAAFDDKMKGAMGDSLRFAAALNGIHAEVGAIKDVISEDIALEHDVWVYRAMCRFEKKEEQALLLIAISPEGKIAGLAVRPQPKEFASTKLDYVTKTSLQLPFKDEWYVFWGGRTIAENYHAASRSQRFAYDLVIMKDTSSHTGDGTKLTDYYCYGMQISAPADGQVVWSCDSLPD